MEVSHMENKGKKNIFLSKFILALAVLAFF